MYTYMFFQGEGLQIFIDQIFRRAHDHTHITYLDAQEILPLDITSYLDREYFLKTFIHKVWRSYHLSLSFCLCRAAPAACGSSQARDQIGAIASGLCHSHSKTRFKPCL